MVDDALRIIGFQQIAFQSLLLFKMSYREDELEKQHYKEVSYGGQ